MFSVLSVLSVVNPYFIMKCNDNDMKAHIGVVGIKEADFEIVQRFIALFKRMFASNGPKIRRSNARVF